MNRQWGCKCVPPANGPGWRAAAFGGSRWIWVDLTADEPSVGLPGAGETPGDSRGVRGAAWLLLRACDQDGHAAAAWSEVETDQAHRSVLLRDYVLYYYCFNSWNHDTVAQLSDAPRETVIPATRGNLTTVAKPSDAPSRSTRLTSRRAFRCAAVCLLQHHFVCVTVAPANTGFGPSARRACWSRSIGSASALRLAAAA